MSADYELGKSFEELMSSDPSPEGEARLVCGRIVLTGAVRSAVGGIECAIAWTTVSDPRTRSSIILPAASDFLLDSAEGRFAVRVGGLVVLSPGEPRPEPLPDEAGQRLRAALEAAGLDPWNRLVFTEIVFHDGDEVAVRGVWRVEPFAGPGYRDEGSLPTLSADRGRLEVELLVPHHQP